MSSSWHHILTISPTVSLCIPKFTGWAIIEELSKRWPLRTFPISPGQKRHVKHCHVDLSSWYDFWVFTSVTLTVDLWPWPFAWTSLLSLVKTPENFMMIWWQEHCEKGVTNRQTGRQTDWCVLRAAWSQHKKMWGAKRFQVTGCLKGNLKITKFRNICTYISPWWMAGVIII